MHKYQNNAFRILGLLPSASMQEIMSRVSEIKVKKSLGFDVSYEFDFTWMGPLDRSEESVINALQRLEDPVSRLKEEILWFWIESKEDTRALDCLKQNKRQSAHEIWRTIAYNINLENSKLSSAKETPTKESIRACLNDAILAHSSVIAKEFNVRYKEEVLREERIVINEESEVLCCPDCHKIYEKEWKICLKCGVKLVVHKNKRKEEIIKSRSSDVVLGESHWKNWRFALDKFCSLDKLEGYWEEVKDKAKTINDARLSDIKISEIKENFLYEISEVNFSFISRALTFKDYERVKRHSSLINGFGLSTQLLKKGLSNVLVSQIELLNQYCKSNAEEMSKLPEDVVIKDVLDMHTRFINKIQEPIYEGNLVDINCISDFALTRDNVAKELRNLANMVNNKFENYIEALVIINEAVEMAASTYVKERFQKDEDTIANNLANQSNASSSVGSNKNSNVGSDGVGSVGKKTNPIVYTKNGIWNKVLIWGGIVIFLVIITSLSKDKSGSSSNYSSPGYSGSSSYQSKKDNLKREIDDARAELASLELSLNSGNNKLKAMKFEIDRLGTVYQDNDSLQYYNSNVDEYNSILATYKRVAEEYETLLSETNAKINRYNELIRR
jgi:hypothetical protein